MVDFRNCSHGALATAATGALLDTDGGRNAGNEIDIRAGKLLDELAGIKTHGIQEPPLSLGKEQIEREGAFARSADASHHDKAAARDTQRKIFKIMLTRTIDGNGLAGFSDLISSVKHPATVAQSSWHRTVAY